MMPLRVRRVRTFGVFKKKVFSPKTQKKKKSESPNPPNPIFNKTSNIVVLEVLYVLNLIYLFL